MVLDKYMQLIMCTKSGIYIFICNVDLCDGSK